ncbi:MAG: hypothetical protein M1821_008540 [Bathelium mastoideum]|nr:MAG: hypothetical protein M1821_008540 [Bathelium mastoideum]KAI9687348.1 MAG: hypothetical protein M1822_002391 [Bathelium mastoideum]
MAPQITEPKMNSTNKTASLMALPTEIRRNILKYSVVQEEPLEFPCQNVTIAPRKGTPAHKVPFSEGNQGGRPILWLSKMNPRFGLDVQLFYVCKTIAAEALELFYKENTFAFIMSWEGIRAWVYFDSFLDTIGPQNRSYLRRLILSSPFIPGPSQAKREYKWAEAFANSAPHIGLNPTAPVSRNVLCNIILRALRALPSELKALDIQIDGLDGAGFALGLRALRRHSRRGPTPRAHRCMGRVMAEFAAFTGAHPSTHCVLRLPRWLPQLEWGVGAKVMGFEVEMDE